ncbi:hypothetical protein M0R45_007927 [Rubus argutus]|uniref:Initiation factor eIF2 gamma C-terminal domain-containing protein n=1 Tax=Rubus argutus TaxID=59490 RepID=A0AAW1Y168_RUBAR
MATGAKVVAVKDNNKAKLQLTNDAVCTNVGDTISISRRNEEHKPWRLIAWGEIMGGRTLDIEPCPILAADSTIQYPVRQ